MNKYAFRIILEVNNEVMEITETNSYKLFKSCIKGLSIDICADTKITCLCLYNNDYRIFKKYEWYNCIYCDFRNPDKILPIFTTSSKKALNKAHEYLRKHNINHSFIFID